MRIRDFLDIVTASGVPSGETQIDHLQRLHNIVFDIERRWCGQEVEDDAFMLGGDDFFLLGWHVLP